MLEKDPAYQFKLAFVYLLYYYFSLNGKTEVLDFLSYKENMEFFSYKFKFYDVADNQIKNSKIFSPSHNLSTAVWNLHIQKEQQCL